MNSLSPPVLSGSNLMASLKLGSNFYGSNQGTWSARIELTVTSNEDSLRRTGEQTWLWRRRRRRREQNCITACATEGNPKSGNPKSASILREAGNKRRAARQADSVIQRIESAKETMERRALFKMSTKLYPRSLLESMEERIAQNRWERALQVFELVRVQEWYTAEESTYIKLLSMLAKAKQPAAAATLFESMLQDKLRPTTAIFTALLTVYSESKLLNKAMELFEMMPRFEGCLPDKYAYTTVIKACCEAGLYDKAKSLFQQMLTQGVEPSIVTYNTLVFQYGKAGLFREIEALLTLMESKGVNSDTVTWNTLIRVFGLHNRIPEMEQAYNALLTQGLLPDSVTLNSLISAYGKVELYGKMECVMDYMRRYNYPLTAVTYTIVIELYGKAGRIDQMDGVFKEMKAKGVKPNRMTFSSILSAYGKHGHWHKVQKILRQVHNYNAGDTAVYNAAIDAYQRAHNFGDMEKLFVEMKVEGFLPDAITYSVMIEAYKRVRKFDKAQELRDEWNASKSKSKQRGS